MRNFDISHTANISHNQVKIKYVFNKLLWSIVGYNLWCQVQNIVFDSFFTNMSISGSLPLQDRDKRPLSGSYEILPIMSCPLS